MHNSACSAVVQQGKAMCLSLDDSQVLGGLIVVKVSGDDLQCRDSRNAGGSGVT